MNARIFSYRDTPYDDIGFRVIPFEGPKEPMYTLVEEKLLGGRVVADIRRQMTTAEFQSLSDAVNSVGTVKADADRWGIIRSHWKNCKTTYDLSNLTKKMVITVEVGAENRVGCKYIDKHFDDLIASKKS